MQQARLGLTRMASAVDVTHQQIILARLADFCRYHEERQETEDLWAYMRNKIDEVEVHVRRLKQEQLLWHRDRFLEAVKAGAAGEREISDFKTILDSYLSVGDFADVAIHLSPEDLADPHRRGLLNDLMRNLKADSLFDEAGKAEGRRSSRCKKLLGELHARLGFEACEQALTRKPRTPRRLRMVLRRVRRNVAEYCAVLHFPASPDDTFSPFLLPRVEALMVACHRLLGQFR